MKQSEEKNIFARNKLLGGCAVFFVSIIGFLIILLFAEFYLRILKPQAIIPRYVTNAPFGIRMNYPNINIWHTTQDYSINIRTNSKGIRADREIEYAKPIGKKRIIVLGDSFTMGYGVNIEDLYLTRLEKKLKDIGYDVDIVNLGVSGFSTAEEVIMLENEGLKYEPNLVILAFFQNDLDENIISGLFKFSDNKLVRNNKEYLPKIKLRNFLYSIPIYRYLAGRSQLLYLVRERMSRMIKSSLLRNSEVKPKEMDRNESKHILGAKLLDRIFEIVNSRGIPLVLLNIPTVENADRKMKTIIPVEKMQEFSELHYLDSYEILKDIPTSKTYWSRSHHHWTPYSHNLVGEKLADLILDNKLID